MTALALLRARLVALADRRGHYQPCNHRFWLGGYGTERGHTPGIDCPDPACPGGGAPCSKRCQETRAALEATTPEEVTS